MLVLREIPRMSANWRLQILLPPGPARHGVGVGVPGFPITFQVTEADMKL
jgi:hypothetical protein